MRHEAPTRGLIWIPYLIALALIGAGLVVIKPKFLDGDTKRASASVEATKKLEDASTAQGAAAAAGVVKIGEANSVAPESPARDFIGREVPSVLSKLPSPDPIALLDAEKRRSAVMEGRLSEASGLYQSEAIKSSNLQKELDLAKEGRRKADLAISEAAAERLGAERQRNIQIAVIVILVALWAYAKFYSISPSTLGRIAADVRSGTPAIQSMDTNLAPWLHSSVRKASQLATPPKE